MPAGCWVEVGRPAQSGPPTPVLPRCFSSCCWGPAVSALLLACSSRREAPLRGADQRGFWESGMRQVGRAEAPGEREQGRQGPGASRGPASPRGTQGDREADLRTPAPSDASRMAAGCQAREPGRRSGRPRPWFLRRPLCVSHPRDGESVSGRVAVATVEGELPGCEAHGVWLRACGCRDGRSAGPRGGNTPQPGLDAPRAQALASPWSPLIPADARTQPGAWCVWTSRRKVPHIDRRHPLETSLPRCTRSSEISGWTAASSGHR